MPDDSLLARLFERLGQRDLDASLGFSLGAEMVERMVAALVENGFSTKTDTWQAHGEMKPISADELRVGIGEQLLFELTSAHALSPDEMTGVLAEHLPKIVRQLRAAGAASPAYSEAKELP